MSVLVCVCVSVLVCVCVRVCVCLCECVGLCLCECVGLCLCECVCVCMCECVYLRQTEGDGAGHHRVVALDREHKLVVGGGLHGHMSEGNTKGSTPVRTHLPSSQTRQRYD